MAFSSEMFLQNAPSYIFDRILNAPLKVSADSYPSRYIPAQS